MCILCNNKVDKFTRELTCDGCDIITVIPTFYQVQKLVINNCKNLHTINPMPQLESLTILNCNKLVGIPEMKNIKYLETSNTKVSHSDSLEEIVLYLDNMSLSCHPFQYTKYPNLTRITFHSLENSEIDIPNTITHATFVNCNKLTTITGNHLSELRVDSCLALVDISVGTIDELICVSCYLLKNIPNTMKYLRLNMCNNIKEISNMDNLEILDCYCCSSLKSISLKYLKSISCCYCNELTTIDVENLEKRSEFSTLIPYKFYTCNELAKVSFLIEAQIDKEFVSRCPYLLVRKPIKI